jgi:hypothetical protein
MVSEDERGHDYLGRSRSCAGGMHKDCGHVGGGVRMVRRPDQLQSTIVLCRCVCHANCPVTGWRHVPLTAWQTLCACPGEKPQRAWKEDVEDPWPGAQEQFPAGSSSTIQPSPSDVRWSSEIFALPGAQWIPAR